MIAYGHRFFKKFFYVLDTVVIATSLTINLVLMLEATFDPLVRLNIVIIPAILLIRLWRLARIMIGIYGGISSKKSRKIRGLRKELRVCRAALGAATSVREE